MAIGKIAIGAAAKLAKAATKTTKNSSAYTTALKKIAGAIPDMKPTVFTLAEVKGLAKFKGLGNEKVFGIAEALLGDNATLTLAKRASKQYAGGSIIGAVIKDADGKIIAKGATLVDEANGTIFTKIRSAFLDFNKRFNPNKLNADDLLKSELKIVGNTGNAEVGNLTLKMGNILDAEAKLASELTGIPQRNIIKDSIKNVKDFLFKGKFPDFQKMVDKYKAKGAKANPESRLAKFLAEKMEKQAALQKELLEATGQKLNKTINKTPIANPNELLEKIAKSPDTLKNLNNDTKLKEFLKKQTKRKIGFLQNS